MSTRTLRHTCIMQNAEVLKWELEQKLGYPMSEQAVERGLRCVVDAVDRLPQKAPVDVLHACIRERVAYLLLVIPIEFPKSR